MAKQRKDKKAVSKSKSVKAVTDVSTTSALNSELGTNLNSEHFTTVNSDRGLQFKLVLPLLAFLFLLITLVAFLLAINNQVLPISSQPMPTSNLSTFSSNTKASIPLNSNSSASFSSSTISSPIKASDQTQTGSVQSGSVTSGIAGSSTNASYTFTAAKGESVSKLARKALNQYLAERGVALNPAQRLFMEVTLTNANNPKFMEIGETRTFSVAQLSATYIQAANLSARQLSAWGKQAAKARYR